MLKSNEEELKNVVDSVLSDAKRLGATAAEVGIGVSSGLSASVRLGTVENIEFSHDKTLSLTVYKGKKKGSTSTTDIRPEALRASLEAACRIAEYTEEDPFSGLADRENIATVLPDLDLYHPWDIKAEDAINWAQQCEDAARSHDSRITNSEGASFSSYTGFRIYGNTHGFIGSYPSTQYSMSCSVIGQMGQSMQQNYDYTVARDGQDLESFTLVGVRAAERTISHLNARKIKTTKAPVIIHASIAPGLLNQFISAISGGNLYRKSSFLLDHLGKQVFPDFITIEEIPHLLKGLASAPFDQEGVATYSHRLVENGILKSYVLGSYSARKLGLKTTGNAGGIHNIRISHSDLDLNGLIKKMGKGLLVTELMGHGINLVTGDYSRGAAGFWIENGEIQFPVEEVTIAGNLKDMFLNLAYIGNDLEKRSSILTGSLLLDNMMIAGS
jgi:PmbA protein